MLSVEPAPFVSVFQAKRWNGKTEISYSKVTSLRDRCLQSSAIYGIGKIFGIGRIFVRFLSEVKDRFSFLVRETGVVPQLKSSCLGYKSSRYARVAH